MTALLRLGQLLHGQNGTYTIGKQLQETVWLAKNESNHSVIVKSVRHFRLQNERDVLKRFRTPFIRPLIDEVVQPSDPPAIVLRHLDENLLDASLSQKLTSQEVKYVARRILEALNILHKKNFVHTGLCDIKPDNVLLNRGQGNMRFSDVQLADLGNTVPSDSRYAKECYLIGAPIWRSPEAILQLGWGTSTDIWSFGALVITLIYGDLFLFKPDVPADHEEYTGRILQRQCQFFGPFPLTYREICSREELDFLALVMQSIPAEKKKPFSRITEKEVSKEDKEFILKIMKLDPRDRPSAAELLQDKWFEGTQDIVPSPYWHLF